MIESVLVSSDARLEGRRESFAGGLREDGAYKSSKVTLRAESESEVTKVTLYSGLSLPFLSFLLALSFSPSSALPSLSLSLFLPYLENEDKDT